MTENRRWHFVTIGLALVAAAGLSGLLNQIANPFLHHDDLDFLLPPGTLFVSDIFASRLTDGRWGYFTWYQVSQHLTMQQSYLPYLVGLIATTAGIASIRPTWAAPLIAFSLFLAAPLIQMSFWAVACTPGMAIAAMAVLAIVKGWRPTLVVLIATPFLLLSYPPFSQFVLAIYVFKEIDRPWRALAMTFCAYLVGYCAGVLAISLINLAVFDHFGIIIREWRQPNSLRSFDDFIVNFGRVSRHLTEVFFRFWPMLALLITGLFACVLSGRRRAAAYLAFTASFLVGIEVGLTLLTGTVSASASFFWIWPVAIAPWAVLAETDSPALRATVASALIVSACTSLVMSSEMLTRSQRVLEFEDHMARTAQLMSSQPDPMIVLYGDYTTIPDLRFIDERDQIHNYFKVRYGIDVVDCYPQDCEAISARLAAGETPPFMLNGAVAIAFAK